MRIKYLRHKWGVLGIIAVVVMLVDVFAGDAMGMGGGNPPVCPPCYDSSCTHYLCCDACWGCNTSTNQCSVERCHLIECKDCNADSQGNCTGCKDFCLAGWACCNGLCAGARTATLPITAASPVAATQTSIVATMGPPTGTGITAATRTKPAATAPVATRRPRNAVMVLVVIRSGLKRHILQSSSLVLVLLIATSREWDATEQLSHNSKVMTRV
jgi:hypothetical protein